MFRWSTILAISLAATACTIIIDRDDRDHEPWPHPDAGGWTDAGPGWPDGGGAPDGGPQVDSSFPEPGDGGPQLDGGGFPEPGDGGPQLDGGSPFPDDGGFPPSPDGGCGY